MGVTAEEVLGPRRDPVQISTPRVGRVVDGSQTRLRVLVLRVTCYFGGSERSGWELCSQSPMVHSPTVHNRTVQRPMVHNPMVQSPTVQSPTV